MAGPESRGPSLTPPPLVLSYSGLGESTETLAKGRIDEFVGGWGGGGGGGDSDEVLIVVNQHKRHFGGRPAPADRPV